MLAIYTILSVLAVLATAQNDTSNVNNRTWSILSLTFASSPTLGDDRGFNCPGSFSENDFGLVLRSNPTNTTCFRMQDLVAQVPLGEMNSTNLTTNGLEYTLSREFRENWQGPFDPAAGFDRLRYGQGDPTTAYWESPRGIMFEAFSTENCSSEEEGAEMWSCASGTPYCGPPKWNISSIAVRPRGMDDGNGTCYESGGLRVRANGGVWVLAVAAVVGCWLL